MQPRFFAIVLLTRLFDAVYSWELIKRKTELTWHLWPPQIGITRRFSMPLLTLLLLLLFSSCFGYASGLGGVQSDSTARPATIYCRLLGVEPSVVLSVQFTRMEGKCGYQLVFKADI